MTSMEEIQGQAHERVSEAGYWDDEKLRAKLQEEIGETKEALSDILGEQTPETIEHLKEEFGDMLFVVLALANKHKVDLEEAFEIIMKKNRERASRNYEK